jgi:CheY-like chemotaxis protein
VWLPLFVVPVATVGLLGGPGSGATPAAPATERLALVVEDDDKAADLVRLLLEAEGFTVLRAASGEAAMLMAPGHALSLITLDLELPGMHGWEFLQRLREHSALADLPVVIIAGVADTNDALNHGASAGLQKPVSRAELKATLKNLGLQPGPDRIHTVLVVDDDKEAVEMIAGFLPEPAYKVVRAYSGTDALALVQRVRPDLILLDLTMPVMDGFEVVAALHRNPDTAHIPIVVVTARQITATDRAALHRIPGRTVEIVEKAGFDRVRFIEQVRRALAAA